VRSGDTDDQLAAPVDRIEGTGVHAPMLVATEVGVSGLHQGVVLGRLDVPVRRVEYLAGDQGLEDGVGRGDGPGQPATGVEELTLGAVMIPC